MFEFLDSDARRTNCYASISVGRSPVPCIAAAAELLAEVLQLSRWRGDTFSPRKDAQD
ncbi:MAG: hypothetical protein WCA99_13070 [Candidatus Sulfotelmatobacter sp.]